MINERDVVRLKMPCSSVSSVLAVRTHMYICRNVNGYITRFVKCQTVKPYMDYVLNMSHYWDENPDITRNPFVYPTRIDCDKEFVTSDVIYDDRLKTVLRSDVCDDVLQHVEAELFCDGYCSYIIDGDDMVALNPLVTRV